MTNGQHDGIGDVVKKSFRRLLAHVMRVLGLLKSVLNMFGRESRLAALSKLAMCFCYGLLAFVTWWLFSLEDPVADRTDATRNLFIGFMAVSCFLFLNLRGRLVSPRRQAAPVGRPLAAPS